MGNKYFGTDGIRGTVNQGNITGEKFFKFGLAAGTYFKNLKKSKQNCNNCERYKTFGLYIRTRIGIRASICRNACLYLRPFANKWPCNAYKKNLAFSNNFK